MDILSSANSKLKQFRLLQRRKHREKLSLVPLEGVTLVEDALRAGVKLGWAVYEEEILTERGRSLLKALEESGVPIFEAAPGLLQASSDVETSQGIICAADMPKHTPRAVLGQDPARVLILDSLQDPGNLGTLFRTALAAGVTGVICTRETVDPLNPKVLRASMGAVFKMPFLKDKEPGDISSMLKQRGLPLYGCHPRKGKSCFDIEFPPSHALVIGSESRGISPLLLEECHKLVTIPLVGPVESLNAATAGAVIIYEALRQNRNLELT